MTAGLIDSHCHLDRVQDLDAALETAREHQLVGMTTIGTEYSQAATQIGLTERSRPDLRIWCTIGTHPDSVMDEPDVSPEDIAERCNHPAVIGIGESGLDFFHGAPSVHARQEASFRAHIAASRMTGLPLVIHAREADADMCRVLKDETTSNGAFPFLLHCFASGPELAREAVRLGGYISFSGIITFPKADTIREVAESIPSGRILVETDSPFLAPVPKRGKPNTPAYVTHTAARLAEIRKETVEVIAQQTTENFFRLFGKAR